VEFSRQFSCQSMRFAAFSWYFYHGVQLSLGPVSVFLFLFFAVTVPHSIGFGRKEVTKASMLLLLESFGKCCFLI